MTVTESFLIGLAGSLCAVIIVFYYNRSSAWLSIANARLGAKWARTDLDILRECQVDPARLDRFVKERDTLWRAIFSAALLIAPLALAGNLASAAAMAFPLTLALYGLSLHTAAMVHWSGRADQFIPVLEKRLATYECKLPPQTA